jgi:hypothetical protein
MKKGLFLRPTWNVEQLSQVQPIVTRFREGRSLQSALKEEGDSQGTLLHNSATPHTAARTLETLRKLKWEVKEHAAHSPDLVPSDFHLFGLLKEALGWRRFGCDKDVKNAVHQWLRAQPETFYYDGIKHLVGRSENVLKSRVIM